MTTSITCVPSMAELVRVKAGGDTGVDSELSGANLKFVQPTKARLFSRIYCISNMFNTVCFFKILKYKVIKDE